jgi:hypothetical protein
VSEETIYRSGRTWCYESEHARASAVQVAGGRAHHLGGQLGAATIGVRALTQLGEQFPRGPCYETSSASLGDGGGSQPT